MGIMWRIIKTLRMMGMDTMKTMDTMDTMSTMNLMSLLPKRIVLIIATSVINDLVKIKSRQRIISTLTARSKIIAFKMKYLTCKLWMMITIITIITTTITPAITTTIRIK